MRLLLVGRRGKNKMLPYDRELVQDKVVACAEVCDKEVLRWVREGIEALAGAVALRFFGFLSQSRSIADLELSMAFCSARLGTERFAIASLGATYKETLHIDDIYLSLERNQGTAALGRAVCLFHEPRERRGESGRSLAAAHRKRGCIELHGLSEDERWDADLAFDEVMGPCTRWDQRCRRIYLVRDNIGIVTSCV